MSVHSMSTSTSDSLQSNSSGIFDGTVSMEHFALLRVLGRGAYGKVFMVRKIGGPDHGRIYAMKVLRKSRIVSKPKSLEHALAERHVLERLKGLPFLVNLIYAFQSTSKLHIVMEFVRGGELFTHLSSHGFFNLSTTRFFVAELVIAIESVHKKNVAYRDLKLENILLDCDGHIKLADFGLSKEVSHEEVWRMNSFCGTIEYMAPEIVGRSFQGYNETVDWWSLGVITFELLTGCSPFAVEGQSNQSRDIARRILTRSVPFPTNLDEITKDFIMRLLEKSPKRRLGCKGAQEIKLHPFFSGIDWNQCARRELVPPIVPNLCNDMDTNNFDPEFTEEHPVYSPSESPLTKHNLFRGYSFVSPSIMLVKSNIVGEECLADDFGAIMLTSPFFSKYKLDQSDDGLLGLGSFSVCRKCERISDGAHFTVKIISRRYNQNATREALILTLVRDHPNVVRLIELVEDNLHSYLVLELLEGGELLSRIKSMSTFTEAQAAVIMKQLVSAVSYLHTKNVVHRDLKPENIIFESKDPHAKLRLVDFGFSRILPSAEHMSTPCFTLYYAAPEVLEDRDQLPQYNQQCDLWSLGVILFTMLSGNVPFYAHSKNESATDIMNRIRNAQFSFDDPQWKDVSNEAKTLIASLLTVDAATRLSANQLSNHPWLNRGAEHNETPLEAPTTLIIPDTEESINKTLYAFMIANRSGFHLMDVATAPLLIKRRGLKRKSRESSMDSIKKITITRCELVRVSEETTEISRLPTLEMLNPSTTDDNDHNVLGE